MGEGVREVVAGDVAAVRGQVVEEGRGFVVEKRQVVFEALRGLAVADLPVERAVGDFFAVVQAGVLAVADATGVGEVDFAARQDADVRVFFEGELAVHREGTDAVDVVVEPFKADGIRRVHRVEVDDAAARGVFAFAGDVDGVLVARLFKAVDEVVAFEAVADAEMDAVAVEVGLRAKALTECGSTGDDNAAFTRRQFGKHAQALGDEIRMRGVLVVRQGFPVAEPVEVCGVIRPVFEVLVPVFGLAGVGGDEEVDVFAGEVAVQVIGQVKGVHGHAAFVGRVIIALAPVGAGRRFTVTGCPLAETVCNSGAMRSPLFTKRRSTCLHTASSAKR